MTNPFDDDDRVDDWDFDDGDDFDTALNECGMGPDGLCSLAGTEHCDWDCPFSDMDFSEDVIDVWEPVAVAEDGTFACSHQPGPATTLKESDAEPEGAHYVVCSECQTHWVIYEMAGVKMAMPAIRPALAVILGGESDDEPR